MRARRAGRETGTIRDIARRRAGTLCVPARLRRQSPILNPSTVCSELAAALDDQHPVVALESTLVTHDMLWPRNPEVARRLEAGSRAGDAVPATIAMIDGTLHVVSRSRGYDQ